MNIPLHTLRQSTAELLAYAAGKILPGILLVDSGITEFGFYYDFISEQPINEYVITLLEEKMRGLIKEDISIRSVEMMRENACSLMEHQEQPLRADFIGDLSENIVSMIQIEDFYDYCPSPPIATTLEIKAFKLLEIESITPTFLTDDHVRISRIHGAAFNDIPSLKKYVKARHAGKKNDHQTIGQNLELFTLDAAISQQNHIWLPRGTTLKKLLTAWWEEQHFQEGFGIISTPSLIKKALLQKAHFSKQNLSPVISVNDVEYAIPPSLASAHAELFRSQNYLRTDLPVRYAECAQIFQLAQKNALWGLLNENIIESDEAHVFCAPNEIEHELISFLQFINKTTKIFNFGCRWSLIGIGQKTTKTPSAWKSGIECFANAFKKAEIDFTNDIGGEVHTKLTAQAHWIDAFGREWNGAQISIDFHLPERLELRYSDEAGKLRTPAMLTRSCFGSLERFIAILIENCNGNIPLWLAPEQVVVIAVNERNNAYAASVCKKIKSAGYRARCDSGQALLKKQIYLAEKMKIPYVITLGDNEEQEQLIALRSVHKNISEQNVSLEDFLERLQEDIISTPFFSFN